MAAPNMNAFDERFVRTIKDECLSRMIFFDEGMLRRALVEFMVHYHEERPHQGLGNVVPKPSRDSMPNDGAVLRRERLGGLLSYYYRKRRTA
ncbi:MAG: transposase [Planctomycetes bacterium]|nr:transposase [Planctomycetota bacterium]